MRRSVVMCALLAALALVAAACGGGTKETGFESPATTPPATGTPTETATKTPTAGPTKVMVVDNAFEPKDIRVKVGTTIVWEQTGTEPHTVTADDGTTFDSHPDCKSFADSTAGKCMGAGDSFEFKAESARSIPYFCRIHGAAGGQGMAGTITIEA